MTRIGNYTEQGVLLNTFCDGRIFEMYNLVEKGLRVFHLFLPKEGSTENSESGLTSMRFDKFDIHILCNEKAPKEIQSEIVQIQKEIKGHPNFAETFLSYFDHVNRNINYVAIVVDKSGKTKGMIRNSGEERNPRIHFLNTELNESLNSNDDNFLVTPHGISARKFSLDPKKCRNVLLYYGHDYRHNRTSEDEPASLPFDKKDLKSLSSHRRNDMSIEYVLVEVYTGGAERLKRLLLKKLGEWLHGS